MTTMSTLIPNERAQPKVWPRPPAFDVLRVMLGLVLLTAAALKGWQLATEPTAETGLLTSRWFLIVGVEVEWFLSVWLLSGLYTRAAWWAALACFTLFAGIALHKVLSGEASCGCFGKIGINPWYTLAFDVTTLGTLMAFRSQGASTRSPVASVPSLGLRLPQTVATAMSVGILGAIGMASYNPATLGQVGQIIGESEFVVLDPEKWVGTPFPLVEYIDIGRQLARGNWIVVLYQHECQHCQEALPHYEQLAQELAASQDGWRLALVEVPPFGEPQAGGNNRDEVLYGHLAPRVAWFVETPAEVIVAEGQVLQAAAGVQAATRFRRRANGT